MTSTESPVISVQGSLFEMDMLTAPSAPQATVERVSSGDYRVVRDGRLVSNHGRRKAEAERKAARVNAA